MRHVDMRERIGPSAAVAGLCIGLALAPDGLTQALAWDRQAIGAGQWWRLWTGHLVHYSLRHAMLDASAVLLLGVIAERYFTRRIVATALLFGAPSISIALWWLVPDLVDYRGASAIATLLGVLSVAALWSSMPRHRVLLAALAAIFFAKTICDALAFQITLAALPERVTVAWQAHVFGIAVAVAALIFWSRGSQRMAMTQAARTHRSTSS
jgi:rhomboid family GlyGly-CTERM serine protease